MLVDEGLVAGGEVGDGPEAGGQLPRVPQAPDLELVGGGEGHGVPHAEIVDQRADLVLPGVG